MRIIIAEPMLTEEGIVEAVALSTGEVFETIQEFYESCVSGVWGNGTTIHTESLHFLEVPLKVEGLKHTTNGKRMKIGATNILEVSKWGLDLTASEESVQKVEELMEAIRIQGEEMPATPAMAAIMMFSSKTRKMETDSLCLEEVLLGSSTYGNSQASAPFQPAYYGGLIARPAKRGKVYRNVRSYDISSAYPAAAISELFPAGESKRVSASRAEELMASSSEEEGFTVMVALSGVSRKKGVRIPSHQKPRNADAIQESAVYDTLGLVSAKEYLAAFTKPEWELFNLHYDFSIYMILDAFEHRLAPLPLIIAKYFAESYEMKSKTVGAERESHKMRINSTIGSWGRDPLKGSHTTESREELEQRIRFYNGSESSQGVSLGVRRSWDFRWAMYLNSYVRLRVAKVERSLVEAGAEVLYADTDSIKFKGGFRVSEIFRKDNALNRTKAVGNFGAGLYETFEIASLGCWQDESGEYKRSVFYEKRGYLRSGRDGVIETVISGASKKEASAQLAGRSISEVAKNDLVIHTPAWRGVESEVKVFGSPVAVQKGHAVFKLSKA